MTVDPCAKACSQARASSAATGSYHRAHELGMGADGRRLARPRRAGALVGQRARLGGRGRGGPGGVRDPAGAGPPRSEERRGGKEWVGTCRSRWVPDHEKKKKTEQIEK